MKFAAIAIMAAGATAVNVTENVIAGANCSWTTPVYEECSNLWWIENTCKDDYYFYAPMENMSLDTKFHMND